MKINIREQYTVTDPTVRANSLCVTLPNGVEVLAREDNISLYIYAGKISVTKYNHVEIRDKATGDKRVMFRSFSETYSEEPYRTARDFIFDHHFPNIHLIQSGEGVSDEVGKEYNRQREAQQLRAKEVEPSLRVAA